MSIFNRFGITNEEGIAEYLKAVSPELQGKINLWLDMAQGRAPWNKENKPCGVIPAIIGAISDPVGEELRLESTNEKLGDILRDLHHRTPEIIGDAVTSGAALIRPIYSNGKCQYEIIKQGFFIPTSRDFDGTLTGAVIMKQLQDGKKQFLLCEVHNYANGTHTVETVLYRLENGNFNKVPLTSCEQTKDITKVYKWENIKAPFVVEVRNPRPNDIDFTNNGIALYGGYENLIEDCDRQYNNLNWEQIAGRTVIFGDEDLFKSRQNVNGDIQAPNIKPELNKVIVKLSGNGTAEEKLYTHSPTLRTEQQIQALSQILRELENVCRIGKGTLSNLEETPQTATQYKGGKQVLYNTVNTFESELERKYKQLSYIFAYMLAAYEGAAFNDDVTITYDESDRKDAALQRQEDIQEVSAGIMNKWEFRVKHYGETEEEAKANTPEELTGGFVL